MKYFILVVESETAQTVLHSFTDYIKFNNFKVEFLLKTQHDPDAWVEAIFSGDIEYHGFHAVVDHDEKVA